MDVINLIESHSVYFWGTLGVLLLVAEVFTLTSVAFVLGSGALTLCIVLAVSGWPESITWQLLAFSTISLLEYWPTKVVMEKAKKNWPKTTGDINDQLADAPDGTVQGKGYVLLDRAFLGDRKWAYEPDGELSVGDRISIKSIGGNKLEVIKKEKV